MKKVGDSFELSATDLVGYLNCHHLAGLDRAVANGALSKPKVWDPLLQILAERGIAHEQSYIEHLTTAGLDVSGAVVGERWRIGTVELEVCQPRLPCNKLALRLGEPLMVKRFAQASRPGAYLRIVAEGSLAAGDEVEVLSVPEHGISVREVSDAILLDETLLERAASAPELPPDLAEWMLSRAA